MKLRLLFFVLALSFVSKTFAQCGATPYQYHMNTCNSQTITTCKGTIDNIAFSTSCEVTTGPPFTTYYTYCDNEDYTVTFCSGTGQPIRINFTSFDTEL